MRKVALGCGVAALLTIAVVIAVVALSGRAVQEKQAETEAQEVSVHVSGTDGTPFSGFYGTASSGTTTVDGVVPQEYSVDVEGLFDKVSATFQKKTQDQAVLTVKILSDGEVMEEQSTNAAFGVANVSWNTNEG